MFLFSLDNDFILARASSPTSYARPVAVVSWKRSKQLR
jgi:hypothetical protein